MDASFVLRLADAFQYGALAGAFITLVLGRRESAQLVHPKDEHVVDGARFWRRIACYRIATAIFALVTVYYAVIDALSISSILTRASLAVLALASWNSRGAQHLTLIRSTLWLATGVTFHSVTLLGKNNWHGSAVWVHAACAFGALFAVSLIPGEPPYERNGMRLAPSSSASASPLAHLFYTFCTPLMYKAAKTKKINADDVAPLGWSLRAAPLRAAAAARYAHVSGPARLLLVILSTNSLLFLSVGGLTILAVFFYYMPAFFMRIIIAKLEVAEQRGDIHSPDTLYAVIPAVVGLCITVVASSTLQGRLWVLLDGGLTVRLTTQLTSMLYDKALRRRSVASTDGSTDAGQAVTLLAVDVRRVVAMAFYMFIFINGPFELLVGGYLAYDIIGISAVVGFLANALITPAVALIISSFQRANNVLMRARDMRMSLLGESITGIYMIKAHAWEARFEERIMKERRNELGAQRTAFRLSIFLTVLLELNPVVMTVVAFTWYTVVLGNTLTPQVAFTTIAVMAELRWVLTSIPESLTNAVQTWVSLKRIQAYLDADEVEGSGDAAVDAAVDAAATAGGEADIDPEYRDIEQDAPRGDTAKSTVAPMALVLHNATVSYPQNGDSFAPRFSLHATLEFGPLSRTLVCGPLGSGKSLLLFALLHEVDVHSGTISSPISPRDGVPATPSAAAAVAALLDTPHWLRNDLVAYAPQSAYVVNASVRDNILFGLPLGNGSRYRAVISACALTRDLETFSHGDLTVIGENGVGISGGQRARIGLARALYSRAGVLLFDDVLSAVDAHTARHLVAHALNGPLVAGRTLVMVSHHVQLVAKSMDQVVFLDKGHVAYCGSSDDFIQSEYFKGSVDEEEGKVEHAEPPAPPSSAPPVQEEGRATGDISTDVWKTYIQAGGGFTLCCATLLLFAMANLWELLSNTWLRRWSTVAGHDVHPDTWWLNRYIVLVCCGAVVSLCRWIALYSMSLRASAKLFQEVLHRVFHATIGFHGSTSRGRLLNRFGHDFEVVDSEFARSCAEVVVRITQLVVMCIATYLVGGWQFFIALGLLSPAYVAIGKVYVTVARDLQRLTSTSRSPVVGAISDAVSGAVVLRAFGAQRLVTMRMLGFLDNNNRFLWWNNQAGRWLSQMYNLVSAFLLFISSMLVLTAPVLTAASAGFAFAFLIDLNFTLLIGMRMYTAMQLSGVAVERVVEYTKCIEQEASPIGDVALPPGWPSQGNLSVENLVVRYTTDGRHVLNGVSFELPARSKLGIVGATGSGKSTLAGAIFRFVEPTSGRIVIDGIDIAHVGLAELRERLELVPQDPVIMSGTLRSTLDVVGKFDDAALYDVLRQVHLRGDNTAEQAPFFNSLDNIVAEGGANLSQGQRQLLCLARAILHKAHVVLFDEASSSIDLNTDELNTQTIRAEFAHSTLLTIAHRLRTIIDYDKVLVLGHGTVLEFGTPHTLLQDPSSHFHAYVYIELTQPLQERRSCGIQLPQICCCNCCSCIFGNDKLDSQAKLRTISDSAHSFSDLLYLPCLVRPSAQAMTEKFRLADSATTQSRSLGYCRPRVRFMCIARTLCTDTEDDLECRLLVLWRRQRVPCSQCTV